MTGQDNISEELRQISAFLATISRVTPYELPDGYFEHLAGRVLDRIQNGQSVLEYGLNNAGQTNWPGLPLTGSAYSVPEGYFEGFAGKLMNRIKAGQQTGALPDKPLAAKEEGLPIPDFGLSRPTTDTGLSQPLPDFASSQSITDFGLSQLTTASGAREELESLSPFLSRIDKKMPFTVPQGYFEELSTAVTFNLANDPTGQEALSPLLAGLKDRQVYQAPDGYFAGLSAIVLEKVKPSASAPAKVISLGVRRNWWKYSAAAVVTGLVLTGGWLWTHTSVTTGAGAASAEITKTLPTVSDQDIENYLDTNNVTNNVPMADDFANSTASLDITDNDIKSFLGDVPDGELKQYIDEHGDVKNLGTN